MRSCYIPRKEELFTELRTALPAGWGVGVGVAVIAVGITDPTAAKATQALCSCHWSHQRRWNFFLLDKPENKRERMSMTPPLLAPSEFLLEPPVGHR